MRASKQTARPDEVGFAALAGEPERSMQTGNARFLKE